MVTKQVSCSARREKYDTFRELSIVSNDLGIVGNWLFFPVTH